MRERYGIAGSRDLRENLRNELPPKVPVNSVRKKVLSLLALCEELTTAAKKLDLI
jgi:hypothetical protein